MSKIAMILIGMIMQSICDNIASIFAFYGSDENNMENTYFHTYNKLLIIASVICFCIFSWRQAEQLYLATILFYVYGLICEGIGIFTIKCYLKWLHKDKESDC